MKFKLNKIKAKEGINELPFL